MRYLPCISSWAAAADAKGAPSLSLKLIATVALSPTAGLGRLTVKLDASADVAAVETCSCSGLLMALTAVPVLLFDSEVVAANLHKAPAQHTRMLQVCLAKPGSWFLVGPHV